jgi:hypothetical protein
MHYLSFIPSNAEAPVLYKQNFLEKLISMLDGTMTEPTLYGWFHLLSLAIVAILCALVIVNRHKVTEKSLRLTLGIVGGVMLALELYKQLVFSYTAEKDSWSYSWYAFPFQFCSTPMYVMFASAFFKEGKIRDCLLAFLATYSLIAGGAVMLYPETVFVETIGVNIQTMFHHGAMVVIAFYLLSSGKIKFELDTILKKALPVFAILVTMAMAMNLTFSLIGPEGEPFNMFFIAPGQDYLLPFLEAIFAPFPYPVYLISYVVFFTVGAYLVLLVAKGIQRVYHSAREKTASENR